jgi:hypothetical protein
MYFVQFASLPNVSSYIQLDLAAFEPCMRGFGPLLFDIPLTPFILSSPRRSESAKTNINYMLALDFSFRQSANLLRRLVSPAVTLPLALTILLVAPI